MPDVSVIIVSWNARDYLAQCLRSLEGDASRAFAREVIVVDNDSRDGSPDAVREGFPWARLMETGANLGFAKGNNVGIRACAGRYICLANSDTVVRPGAIDALARCLNENPGVGMVAPRILNPDGTIQPSCRRLPSLRAAFFRAFALDTALPSSSALAGSFLPVSEHRSRCEAEVVSGCFCMARREAMDQAGLLDEDFFMYSEDIDWCKRFGDKGWKIVFLPNAEVEHFGGASSANAPTRFSVEQQQADLLYWRKHSGKIAQICHRALLIVHQILRLAPRAVAWLLSPKKRDAQRGKMAESWACLKALFQFSSHSVPAKRAP